MQPSLVVARGLANRTSHATSRLPDAVARVGVLMLAVAYLAPGHFLPWASFHSQWIAALALVLVGVGAATRSMHSGFGPRWPALALLSLGLAVVPWLQLAAGQLAFLSDALLPSAYLVAMALSVVTGQILGSWNFSRWLDALFLALMFAAGVSVALALSQWAGVRFAGIWVADLPPGGRPFANLGQPNHLALLCAIAMVGGLRAFERGQLGSVAAVAVSGWFALGIVMPQSRAGWLMVLLIVLGALALRRRAELRVRPAALLGAVALFAAAVLLWAPLNELLLMRMNEDLETRAQSGPRWAMWQHFVDAASRAPWAGYGWNQVTLAQQAVALDHPVFGRMSQNAHNTVLDLALWGGIPMALLCAGGVGWWLLKRTRACRDADTLAALLAVGVVLLHAMFEFPLDHAYFLLPTGLFIGLLAAGRQPAVAARPAPVRATLLLVAVVAMAWLLFRVGDEYIEVERANGDARLLLAGIGVDKVRHVPAPEVQLLDGPREYHRFMLTSARPGMSAGEIEWMRRVSQRNAYPPAMMRFALAAGLNGHPDEAARTLRRLCHIHPTARCEEARSAWRQASTTFPALAGIPGP